MQHALIFVLFFLTTYITAQSNNSSPQLSIRYSIDDKIQAYELDLASIDKLKTYETPHFKVQTNSIFSERYQLTIAAKTKVVLEEVKIILPHQAHKNFEFATQDNAKDLHAYFCNGFQSWTTSQELGIQDKIRNLWSLIKPYGQHLGDYNHYYKYPNKKGILHSWSFTYKRLKEEYSFIGSINEETGYTLFVHDAHQEITNIQKDCKGLVLNENQSYACFDLILKKGTQSEIWDAYTKKFGPNPSKAKPAIGWTSWYNYYTKITEEIIQENLDNYSNAGIPLDIFQIDDGYQSAIGDWLVCNEKFPNGMKPISEAIHKKGYQAGLWLAPFVASKKSAVFKEHPDWFVKGKNGKPLRVAINVMWGGPYYPLDIYHPEARDYIKKMIHGILIDWNFDLIKVDFLFAVCLQARPDKTRGTIMYDAMKFLRECAGDKLILGCGVPLAPSFHQVDYCRVGNDAHLGWDYKILKTFGNAERPSTWSTLTNTILRYPLSEKLFLNDPDVFILRTKKTRLTDEEKYTMLFLNNLLGAVIFNSDNIGNYDSLQLQQYKSIFPYVKPEKVRSQQVDEAYTIHFEMNQQAYLFLTNLGKKTAEMQLPKGRYFDTHKKELLDIPNSSSNTLVLNAHASHLLCRIKGTADVEVMGGNNHLISGQSIERIDILATNSIRLTFKEQAQQSQAVYLFVKDPNLKRIYINGTTFEVKNHLVQYLP